MGWQGIHSSVLWQGSDTGDFDTPGAFDEIEIGCGELSEYDEPEGEVEEYDDSERIAPVAQRRKGSMETIGFEKFEQGPGDTEFQDWGDFLKLRRVMSRKVKRIAATYVLAGDHSQGPIPRAREDGDATASLWNLQTDTPAGLLPIYVNLLGAMRPELDEAGSGSYYTLSFEWEETTLH